MNADEEAVVRAFVVANRRPRWLESLAVTKRRRKFLDRLNHCRDFDERFASLIPPNCNVEILLRERGAPSSCHVLSAVVSLDGRQIPLSEAIQETERCGWGTIISCIPGRLAYYYDECGERRMLLERSID